MASPGRTGLPLWAEDSATQEGGRALPLLRLPWGGGGAKSSDTRCERHEDGCEVTGGANGTQGSQWMELGDWLSIWH